jgi:type IV secretion system protein VirB9
MSLLRVFTSLAAGAVTTLSQVAADAAELVDPRLLQVAYNPAGVLTVPVKRGIVTLVVLGHDEAITEVASGIGADCTRPEAAWCVAAQPGGRTIFVKPKTSASVGNNLAVVTDRRIHTFRFDLLADNDPRPPVYRLVVTVPAVPRPVQHSAPSRLALLDVPMVPLPDPIAPEQVVAERLQAKPNMLNMQYSLAAGAKSEDIVPTLVFDDGRFTYLRFPGNREVPAIFDVLGDGSEALANTRMEDDLLVVDRVSRRLMLRAGNAVVGLWNEAFDLEGAPPAHGTTVPGVHRFLKAHPVDSVAGLNGARP